MSRVEIIQRHRLLFLLTSVFIPLTIPPQQNFKFPFESFPSWIYWRHLIINHLLFIYSSRYSNLELASSRNDENSSLRCTKYNFCGKTTLSDWTQEKMFLTHSLSEDLCWVKVYNSKALATLILLDGNFFWTHETRQKQKGWDLTEASVENNSFAWCHHKYSILSNLLS